MFEKLKKFLKIAFFLALVFLIFALVWWLGPEIKIGDSRPLDPVIWRILVLVLIVLLFLHSKILQVIHYIWQLKLSPVSLPQDDLALHCHDLITQISIAEKPTQGSWCIPIWRLKWLLYPPDYIIFGDSLELESLTQKWPHPIDWQSDANPAGRSFLSDGRSWLIIHEKAGKEWAKLLRWRASPKGMIWVSSSEVWLNNDSRVNLHERVLHQFPQWSRFSKRRLSLWLLVVDLEASNVSIACPEIDALAPYGFCIPKKGGRQSRQTGFRKLSIRFLRALYRASLSEKITSESSRLRFKIFRTCASQIKAMHEFIHISPQVRGSKDFVIVSGVFWVWDQPGSRMIGLPGFIQSICRQPVTSPRLYWLEGIKRSLLIIVFLSIIVWIFNNTYARSERHLRAQQFWIDQYQKLHTERDVLSFKSDLNVYTVLDYLTSLDQLKIGTEKILNERLKTAPDKLIREAYINTVSQKLLPVLQNKNSLCASKYSLASSEQLYRSLAFSLMLDTPGRANKSLMAATLKDCLLQEDEINRAMQAWERVSMDVQSSPQSQTSKWRSDLANSKNYSLDEHIWRSLLALYPPDSSSNYTLSKALGFEKTWFQNLSEVPWLFTQEGMQLGYSNATEHFGPWSDEYYWVMGQSNVKLSSSQLNELNRLVAIRYAAEATTAWDRWLQNVHLFPVKSLIEATIRAQYFAGEGSPLVSLLRSLQDHIPLPEEKKNSLWKRILGRIESDWENLRFNFGWRNIPSQFLTTDAPEEIIARHFELLRSFFLDSNGKSPKLDLLLRDIDRLSQEFSELDAIGAGGNKISSGDATQDFLHKANLLPSPLKQVLSDLTAEGSHQFDHHSEEKLLSSLLNIKSFAVCKYSPAIFPFDISAKAEIPWAEFIIDFSNQGKIRRFVEDESAYLDMQSHPWSYHTKGIQKRNDLNYAAQWLERATMLSQAWFASNSQTLTFYIKFAHLDPAIKLIRLNINGQLITYAHGQTIEKKVEWDSQAPNASVQMEIVNVDGKTMKYRYVGPWALLRWSQSAKQLSSSDLTITPLEFNSSDGFARIEVRADGPRNPLNLMLYENFCQNINN